MAYHGYAARPPRPPPPPAPYHRQQQPNGYARAAPATNGYRTQPKDRPPVRRTTNGTQPRKQRRGQGSLERRREARAAARAAVASGSSLSAVAATFQPPFQPMPQEEPTSQWPGYRVICEQLGDEDPRNRASAVQTLRLMTHHQPSQNPWGGPAHRPAAAVRAVVEHDGVAPLVGLLSQESNPESQIAAADVLRQVVSTSRPQQQPQRLETVMREDITAPIVGMLGSDRERVRSSALGAISQLARAGGEARHRVFSEPFLLPRLLDVTECLQEKPGDVDDAVGVLQLMLDDEQTSQEAKEAIVKRPGVVESIVATATRALPPAEEAALQARGCDLDQTTENSVSAQNATKALVGLGREGISEAAKAVVGVLEDNDDWAKKQAAMATMRTLIDSEVACEESAVLSDDDEEPPGALQAVRDAGGVEKVVELLEDGDEWGQASAALTLQTFVRAGDAVDDEEVDEETLRSELAETDTVQKLVTMLSRGHERPAAAVQAAGALAALVEPQEHEEPQKDILRTQLKEAVNEDDSVIPTVVNLLQNVLEEDDNDGTAARDLAETLRNVADGDLSNQLQIRDAGGVRPLLEVVAQEEDIGKALLASSTAALRCRDDVQVRVGLPCREERLYARLVAHPAGFRRWFVRHQLAERSRRRTLEALEDARRLKQLMGLCRDEKEDLLSRLDGARPASPRGELRRPLDASVVVPARLRPRPGGAAPAGSGLVRYELLQCEMRELEELEASVLGYQPTHQIIDDAANPAAELQLLNTTLAVLGSEPLA
ncbi:unnamed protein product [Pelagomonas calceolata]|uniref:Uncharacterized protein n=1 Tax=Pelagomonas calceolata TaxID=35677 RepID=A0A8J2T312_9STRA|nr:unnamed protein product [Pelagomonas calceolata]|mmetsp:Transcript_7797/g.19318  ORF Transcript_7797/g.19318 Transcript_7797/m.19318 type:complete len:775 (-) Transcript_7797:44-2368(-)